MAFMVLQDDFSDLPREVYIFQYFIAILGVSLYQRIFCWFEFAWFGEYFRRHRDLANVV